jgi:DNA-directed RNA polymerase subunit RPC12/RpoP
MSLTRQIKRLAGIASGETGVESSRERTLRECTVCGEQFDSETVVCPNCGGRISRTKTIVPYALVNLVVVLAATGLHVVRNAVTGDLPKE